MGLIKRSSPTPPSSDSSWKILRRPLSIVTDTSEILSDPMVSPDSIKPRKRNGIFARHSKQRSLTVSSSDSPASFLPSSPSIRRLSKHASMSFDLDTSRAPSPALRSKTSSISFISAPVAASFVHHQHVSKDMQLSYPNNQDELPRTISSGSLASMVSNKTTQSIPFPTANMLSSSNSPRLLLPQPSKDNLSATPSSIPTISPSPSSPKSSSSLSPTSSSSLSPTPSLPPLSTLIEDQEIEKDVLQEIQPSTSFDNQDIHIHTEPSSPVESFKGLESQEIQNDPEETHPSQGVLSTPSSISRPHSICGSDDSYVLEDIDTSLGQWISISNSDEVTLPTAFTNSSFLHSSNNSINSLDLSLSEDSHINAALPALTQESQSTSTLTLPQPSYKLSLGKRRNAPALVLQKSASLNIPLSSYTTSTMPSTLNTLHTPLSIATTPCSDYYSTSDSSAPASPQTPDSYVSEEEFSSTLDPHKQHKNLQLNTEAQSESTSTLTKSATRSSSTSSSFSSYSEQIVSDDVCVIMEHGIVWVGKTIEVVEDSVDSEPRSIKSMKSSESFSSSKLTETLSNTSSLDPSSMPAPKLVFPIPSLALPIQNADDQLPRKFSSRNRASSYNSLADSNSEIISFNIYSPSTSNSFDHSVMNSNYTTSPMSPASPTGFSNSSITTSRNNSTSINQSPLPLLSSLYIWKDDSRHIFLSDDEDEELQVESPKKQPRDNFKDLFGNFDYFKPRMEADGFETFDNLDPLDSFNLTDESNESFIKSETNPDEIFTTVQMLQV